MSENFFFNPCRSLRGNVDRNFNAVMRLGQFLVVPYVGTWIEISGFAFHGSRVPSRSLRGNVDRNGGGITTPIAVLLSFPTWERG